MYEFSLIMKRENMLVNSYVGAKFSWNVCALRVLKKVFLALDDAPK